MSAIRENYVLILLLILAIAGTFLWLLRFRERLKISWWAALLMAIGHVLFGVVCVHVFARFEGASIGAMSIFGAVFFLPIALYLDSKILRCPASETFDILVIPMIFTLFLTRINCLISGCCFGIPIGSTNLHWPTREAEMLYYIVFILFVAPKVLKEETHGEIYPLYMGSYGIARGIIEFVRYSPGAQTIFHLSHIWAFLSITLGFSIYFEVSARYQKKKK